MDESNDDELFLYAVDHIVLEALATIGNDPRARFGFFRRILAAAREATSASRRWPELDS